MKVPFNINLSGKIAIVTGGSGTLCSAMAYGLAVCGAKVAIIGRNTEKLTSVSEKLTKDALDEYNKNVTILSGILMKTESVMLWTLITWELFFLFRYSLRIWSKREAEALLILLL